jgi:hypothetical protein
MIHICPTGVCARNLRRKVERGKITSSEFTTRFRQVSCFKKPARSEPETWGHMYNVPPQSAKGMRKRDEKSDSCAAEKGVKKLVSSNFAKILK